MTTTPNHLASLVECEREVESLTRDFLGDYAVQMELGFDLFTRWQVQAMSKRWDSGPFHALVLFVRLRNHFWNTWRLLLQGYYLDSVNLHKTAFETFFLADYLLKNPEKAVEWEKGKRIPPKAVRKTHQGSDELGNFYDQLCEQAHPNAESHVQVTDRHCDLYGKVSIGAIYDPELVVWHLARLRPIFWASLGILRHHFLEAKVERVDDALLMRIVNANESELFVGKIREYKAARAAENERRRMAASERNSS